MWRLEIIHLPGLGFSYRLARLFVAGRQAFRHAHGWRLCFTTSHRHVVTMRRSRQKSVRGSYIGGLFCVFRIRGDAGVVGSMYVALVPGSSHGVLQCHVLRRGTVTMGGRMPSAGRCGATHSRRSSTCGCLLAVDIYEHCVLHPRRRLVCSVLRVDVVRDIDAYMRRHVSRCLLFL